MSKKSISKERIERLIVSTFASTLLANLENEEGAKEIGLRVCAALSAWLELSDKEMEALRARAEEQARMAIDLIHEQDGATIQ